MNFSFLLPSNGFTHCIENPMLMWKDTYEGMMVLAFYDDYLLIGSDEVSVDDIMDSINILRCWIWDTPLLSLD